VRWVERRNVNLGSVLDNLIYAMDLTSLYTFNRRSFSLQQEASCSGELLLGSNPQQSMDQGL
jgi:hypothetical protein